MEADRWIERVSAQRTHLPESAELVELEAELRALQKSLLEIEAVAGPLKSAYEGAARESSRLKKTSERLDSTLTASTANARELGALQKELTHVRMLVERERRSRARNCCSKWILERQRSPHSSHGAQPGVVSSPRTHGGHRPVAGLTRRRAGVVARRARRTCDGVAHRPPVLATTSRWRTRESRERAGHRRSLRRLSSGALTARR